MGVMQCSRAGCNVVLCERYHRDYGYICDDDFEDLVRSGTSDIEAFMTTPAPQHPGREFYQKIFPYISGATE